MEITGLDKPLMTLVGKPFVQFTSEDGGKTTKETVPTFREWLFGIALTEEKDEDEKSKLRKFKLSKKIAEANGSLTLTDEEIDKLKTLAAFPGRSIQFMGCVRDALDAGGIKKQVPEQ